MDTSIGIVGKDFVMIAADTSNARSVLRFTSEADKIMALDTHKLMAYGGETGDYLAFSEMIQKNIALNEFRTGKKMSTHAAVHFTRHQLATALRRGPYNVNLLVGGFDEDCGASLYWLDYLGTMQKMNIAAHGYGAYFTLSILDRYWKAGLDEQEAARILSLCLSEMKTRFLISTPNFCVKVVDKNGVRRIDLQNYA
jgi:20S proteasome subunit beta 4